MDERKDSKIARSFLRMILREQGQPIPEELVMNSWEMVDLIIKNIHLVDIEVKHLRTTNKKLMAEKETHGQRVLAAIDAFYKEKH